MSTDFQTLPEAFDFDRHDLESNRQGTITRHQQARLKGIAAGLSGSSSKMLIGIIIFIFLVGSFYWFYAVRASSGISFTSPQNIAILIVALAAPIVIVAASRFHTQRRASELLLARLKIAEGPAKVRTFTSPRHSGTNYGVSVGGKEFTFVEEYGGLFKQGVTYNVYYVQAGTYDVILSVDELE